MNNELKLAYAYFAKFVFENHDKLSTYCIDKRQTCIEVDFSLGMDSFVLNVYPENNFYSIYKDSVQDKYYKYYRSLDDLIHDFEEKVL